MASVLFFVQFSSVYSIPSNPLQVLLDKELVIVQNIYIHTHTHTYIYGYLYIKIQFTKQQL